jgi:hypothetical protein
MRVRGLSFKQGIDFWIIEPRIGYDRAGKPAALRQSLEPACLVECLFGIRPRIDMDDTPDIPARS